MPTNMRSTYLTALAFFCGIIGGVFFTVWQGGVSLTPAAAPTDGAEGRPATDRGSTGVARGNHSASDLQEDYDQLLVQHREEKEAIAKLQQQILGLRERNLQIQGPGAQGRQTQDEAVKLEELRQKNAALETAAEQKVVLYDRLQAEVVALRERQVAGGRAGREPLSHAEVDAQPHVTGSVQFADTHQHKDSSAVAHDLSKRVRVLCWVMTSPDTLNTRAVHVRDTWGKRCNKMLFFSDKDDADFPAIGVQVQPGRIHLTAKTMQAFRYIYKHHMNDYDWFLKADDDTYVIVENLRYFLSAQSSSEPVYFGHHFKTLVKQGYFSGGAGYVLSRAALAKLGEAGDGVCRQDYGAEDAEMGHCMERLGVRTGDSRDRLGRSRFHCFNPGTHVHGGYPGWYHSYDTYGAKHGVESISDYAISFHYVAPNLMYELEFFVYHMRPYGYQVGLQELNGKPDDNVGTELHVPTTSLSPQQKQQQQQQPKQQQLIEQMHQGGEVPAVVVDKGDHVTDKNIILKKIEDIQHEGMKNKLKKLTHQGKVRLDGAGAFIVDGDLSSDS